MSKSKGLIIIPAFNEENNIGTIINEIQNCRINFDVLIIDDGSTDATAEVARSHDVLVVSLPFNLGIGGAVQTGFKFALRNGYNYAIQVDADGQHNPSEIEKLFEPLKEGEFDVVIGSRYLDKNDYQTTFFRRVGAVIFMGLNFLTTGQKIKDNTSGFRCYNRRTIEFLSKTYPDDYPEVEAIAVLGKNGFRIKEIPVRMRSRHSGSSSITNLKSIYYMIKVSLAILINVFRSKEMK